MQRIPIPFIFGPDRDKLFRDLSSWKAYPLYIAVGAAIGVFYKNIGGNEPFLAGLSLHSISILFLFICAIPFLSKILSIVLRRPMLVVEQGGLTLLEIGSSKSYKWDDIVGYDFTDLTMDMKTIIKMKDGSQVTLPMLETMPPGLIAILNVAQEENSTQP